MTKNKTMENNQVTSKVQSKNSVPEEDVTGESSAKPDTVGHQISQLSEIETAGQKVPNQLIMEFLVNLMKHDYSTAEKLCQMILLYDPKHSDALQFQPLLHEMIQSKKETVSSNDDSEAESESESDGDDFNGSASSDSDSDDSDTTETSNDDTDNK